MTQAEFDAECRKLCAHCAANEKVRWRDNTREFVHDFAFGNVDPKMGRRAGMVMCRVKLRTWMSPVWTCLRCFVFPSTKNLPLVNCRRVWAETVSVPSKPSS